MPSTSKAESRKKPRRRPNPEATRTLILDAVHSTIYEMGFAGCTLIEILQRAGVKQGTLQHHFPTKVDLYREALKHAITRQIEYIQAQSAENDLSTNLGLIQSMENMFESREFYILMEFWMAARVDNNLRNGLMPLHALGTAMLESKKALVKREKRFESAIIFHVLRSLALDRMIGANATTDAELRDYLRTLA